VAKVNFEETLWKVTRQAPTTAGARAEGDRLPEVPESGLWFHSDKGEALFHPMPYSELPSQEQLGEVPLAQIHEMISAARRRAQST
jgi:hypothetical protein